MEGNDSYILQTTFDLGNKVRPNSWVLGGPAGRRSTKVSRSHPESLNQEEVRAGFGLVRTRANFGRPDFQAPCGLRLCIGGIGTCD